MIASTGVIVPSLRNQDTSRATRPAARHTQPETPSRGLYATVQHHKIAVDTHFLIYTQNQQPANNSKLTESTVKKIFAILGRVRCNLRSKDPIWINKKKTEFYVLPRLCLAITAKSECGAVHASLPSHES